MKKQKRIKEKPYPKLKKELDTIFSVFIRMRDKGKCYTCGAQKRWKETDAGHYIKRNHIITRWDERNVHCQCMGCNRFRDGNKEAYATRLEKQYGFGILQELENLKNRGGLVSAVKVIEKIKYYKERVKELENEE